MMSQVLTGIHSCKEYRCFALGKTDDVKYLFVVFTKRAEKIRVISARMMNKKECSIRIKCRKSAIMTKVPKKIGGQYNANQSI